MSDWKERIKELAKVLGFTVDVEELERILEEYRPRLEKARELRYKNADWEYIESREEPLRTALKLLVETGDVKYVSAVTGIPPEALECYRMKARIPRVIL